MNDLSPENEPISAENVRERSWQEFRETGLLLLINQLLHAFGWAIVVGVKETVEPGRLVRRDVRAFPARVRYRGFGEESQDLAYRRLAAYVRDHGAEVAADLDGTSDGVAPPPGDRWMLGKKGGFLGNDLAGPYDTVEDARLAISGLPPGERDDRLRIYRQSPGAVPIVVAERYLPSTGVWVPFLGGETGASTWLIRERTGALDLGGKLYGPFASEAEARRCEALPTIRADLVEVLPDERLVVRDVWRPDSGWESASKAGD